MHVTIQHGTLPRVLQTRQSRLAAQHAILPSLGVSRHAHWVAYAGRIGARHWRLLRDDDDVLEYELANGIRGATHLAWTDVVTQDIQGTHLVSYPYPLSLCAFLYSIFRHARHESDPFSSYPFAVLSYS